MNEEERQRQMDFIVNNLAAASAKIDGLAEKVDSLAEMHKLSEQERRMSEQERRVSEQERKADVVRIARLEEAFVVLSHLSQRFDERLDEHQTQISDVKNAIVILTRLVSERQNGKS
jgi:plasmid stabilization system protein ParE